MNSIGDDTIYRAAATQELLSLAAKACNYLEEIRDEIKLRKDDGM